MATDRLKAAERLGYLPENGPLYADMTPRSLLTFFGNLRGLSPVELDRRLEVIISTCHLEAVIGKPIGKLSKGYRQRVGMAQALLHDPEVLVLDEPTAGLDPNQIREVRKMIRELGTVENDSALDTHPARSRSNVQPSDLYQRRASSVRWNARGPGPRRARPRQTVPRIDCHRLTHQTT